jgi:hypothetical protein
VEPTVRVNPVALPRVALLGDPRVHHDMRAAGRDRLECRLQRLDRTRVSRVLQPHGVGEAADARRVNPVDAVQMSRSVVVPGGDAESFTPQAGDYIDGCYDTCPENQREEK